MPSSSIRAARLPTASRDRRQAASAASRPIAAERLRSGWSISNCTRAVVAAVEPRTGPRRSIARTARPAAVRVSATMAPEMPIPTTSTSVFTSRARRSTDTRGAR